jgi:hypothetical protein
MKFQVDVVFEMCNAIVVEAENQEEAIQKAWEKWDKMPAQGEYIDDSSRLSINPDYDGGGSHDTRQKT